MLDRDRGTRWRAALSKTPVGVCELDLAGRVVSANPAMLQMLGYPVDELEGTSFVDHVHADDRASSNRQMVAVASGGRSKQGVLRRMVTATGADLWIHISKCRVKGIADGPDRILVYAVDLTEQQTARRLLDDAIALSRRWSSTAPMPS